MKVLVYIGLNECWTLNQLLPYFDRVIALDPLPRTKDYIDPLLKKYSHLEFYPYAADTEYKKTNFNISPASGCSSSLLKLNTQDVIPKDINDFLGAREISKDNSYIEFMSNPNKIPEELKDFPIKINDLIDTPPSAMKKTHSQDYGDIKFASYLRSQTFAKDRKKYKVYK